MPVVSLACPKCGKEATEYAPNKWRCLHCGRKFLYEEPKATIVNSSRSGKKDFQQQAEQAAPGLVSEFIDFVLHNKKWWMIPIVVSLLILGLLVFLMSGAGGVAPFIYTLF
jgi:DNA-directed RNA polymerase subunit RPC12/RpoP